ncbi:MAG: hypothetical protein LZ173_09005 [Thaumarchaeota archaeon]|jgi:hypothetical protein|nr:hypothetical protein [Candidatus Geocrenenecus arthurdayi]
MLKVRVYEGGESEPKRDWRGRFFKFTFFERYRISIAIVGLANDYARE